MIREELREIILNAIKKTPKLAKHAQKLDFTVERPRMKKFGDWSTNVAMTAAPIIKKSPMELAEAIKSNISYKYLDNVQAVKPGFINLFFKREWYYEVLKEIEKLDDKYGRIDFGKGQKVLLEYVSANPVGPLHLGHGRWAAVGDTLTRVLRKTNFYVETEFYVNNYGRQMELFFESVIAAYYKQEPPKDGYKGTYITDIAKELRDVVEFELTEENRSKFEQLAFELIMTQITASLKKMGVEFNNFFHEKEQLHQRNLIAKVINKLKKDGKAYEKEGALWLNTSKYGDEKDRVLVRSTGEPTYFAADVAYHQNKLARKYDKLVNIWGADHHGYIARIKAAIFALGEDPDKLTVILGQLVNLYREGTPVKMSKRTGELITIDELIDEVGKDAVRYTFLTKSTDSPLDFDIDLVKEQSDKNPVYYVQYAHARISSILKFAESKGVAYKGIGKANLSLLNNEAEVDLIKKLEEFEEINENIAKNFTPHLLTTYAQNLATTFHSFYTVSRVITDDDKLTQARLALLNATHITLRNVLKLLGVSAPEKM